MDKVNGTTANMEYFRFILIRDFLYKVHIKKINDNNIKVKSCWKLLDIGTKILIKAKPDTLTNTGLNNFGSSAIYFHIEFNDIEYMITTEMRLELRYTEGWIHNISIKSLDDEKESNTQQTLDYLIISALNASSLNNNIVLIKSKNFFNMLLEEIELLNPRKIKLDDIFLPHDIESHIKRFISEVNNYSQKKGKLKKQFRFLLSGRPGTAKSQIINAILNCVYGNITVVVINGIDCEMTDIIDFCRIFDPCLLVIDDMDFLARKRDENFNSDSLVKFLHALDGLMPDSLFLLGATNDKFLVDEAASRPGRFDMILDISTINKEDYLD